MRKKFFFLVTHKTRWFNGYTFIEWMNECHLNKWMRKWPIALRLKVNKRQKSILCVGIGWSMVSCRDSGNDFGRFSVLRYPTNKRLRSWSFLPEMTWKEACLWSFLPETTRYNTYFLKISLLSSLSRVVGVWGMYKRISKSLVLSLSLLRWQ